MAGRPGRSGGWNKLSDEAHRVRGTRPRLRAQPAVLTATITPPADPVPADVVLGLQAPGRAFAEALWREYQPWGGAEQALLRHAARCLDDAETAIRSQARQASIRLFAALIAQLRLQPARPTTAAANPLAKFLTRPGMAG